jgi:hypothetical protein
MDVEVIRKDGLILIREMAAEVKNMMDIKMNAVMVSTVCQFLILIREMEAEVNNTSDNSLHAVT